jgi:hypothetical protein
MPLEQRPAALLLIMEGLAVQEGVSLALAFLEILMAVAVAGGRKPQVQIEAGARARRV